jgi:hypothetical protein
VDVRNDRTLADFQRARAAQRLVLADRRDVVRQDFLDGLARWHRLRLQRLDVAAGCERDLRDVTDERLELVVLRDEIGLRVHFDRCALGARHGDAD